MQPALQFVLTTGLAIAHPAAAAQTFDWTAAHAKAATALTKLSLQDKIDMVTGLGWGGGPCVGNTKAIESIGYPSLCLQDSALGIRYGAGTAFVPGIQAAATWDVALMRQRGEFLGAEAKAAGIHNLLGPVAGPLGSRVNGGRGWEGFGVDPYLAGIATQETIIGMQGSGVQATAKHFILNEQEVNRVTISSSVDDRSLHELYLWPFADAVYAGCAAVMCSYNKVNSTWACENDQVLNQLLKTELGFKGYVVTDWYGPRSQPQFHTLPSPDTSGGETQDSS